MTTRKCAKCQKVFPATLDHFYKRSGRGEGALIGYCKACYNDIQKNKHNNVKQMLIDYRGGSCVVCGYNKCNAAMDFHHIDPSKKELKIGQTSRTFEALKKEADKCVVACRNCHAEIHQGLHPEFLK